MTQPPTDPLAEIRRLYFETKPSTILRDFDRAIDLLKMLPTEAERERATVYMEGLAEMRKEFGKRRDRNRWSYLLVALVSTRRAARRSISGTFRSVVSILMSFSVSRCMSCIEIAGGVFGLRVTACTMP